MINPPYSPRYPRFFDPWTCNYSLPLWYRVQECKNAAVMRLLRSSPPDNVPVAVLREAIRIAGQPNNRRAFASVYEENRTNTAVEKALVRAVRRVEQRRARAKRGDRDDDNAE